MKSMSEPGNGRPAEVATAAVGMKRVLEALFYACPDPVTLQEVKEAFGAERAEEIDAALADLLAEYQGGARGLTIERIAGGFRVVTHPDLAGILREFVKRRNRTRLSRAALETLAMIAYRQPVTSPEIEAVRGVNPQAILKSLLERRLVKIVGRKRVVGKPFLYGTTETFLEHFGLNSLDDLPSMEDFAGLLDGALASAPSGEPLPAEEALPDEPAGAGESALGARAEEEA